jgi:hypothetical protein
MTQNYDRACNSNPIGYQLIKVAIWTGYHKSRRTQPHLKNCSLVEAIINAGIIEKWSAGMHIRQKQYYTHRHSTLLDDLLHEGIYVISF